MSHSWLAYLPPHLAADLLAHPSISPLDRVLRQEAVALLADLSGFTPMSEALGLLGPLGTEELSSILNRAFGAMITIITQAGGSIGKFAGDALTVVFPYSAPTRHTIVCRAIQCALDMQAAMADQGNLMTSAGPFQLSMKIGLGMGQLLTTTVGDSSIRLEYLLAGSAIDHSAEAEQHAPKGAVIVHDDLLPLVGSCDTRSLMPHFQQIISLHRRPKPPARMSLPAPDAAVTTPYLPPAIVERMAHGHPDFVNEHRRVTALFVRFSGFGSWDDAVLPRLKAYLQAVVQISDRYGSYLRQVDVGDKGSLFIVLFGAPIAHEDDAERALRCALDLRAMAENHRIVTASGIATGQIFCGFVGSDQRREYAAIGDSVNLAARLMSAADWGSILVDLPSRQRTERQFTWQDRPPITVKGKAAPIPVALLEQQRQRSPTRLRAPGYTLAMVGRSNELDRCSQALVQICRGQGQVIGITGEAGMGKSRLVAEVMRAAARHSITSFASESRSYAT